MIRLTLKAEPAWLELPAGVRVHVRPLTTALAEAARFDAMRRCADAQREAKAAADAGMPLDAVGFTHGNYSAVVGSGEAHEIEALARFGVMAWEGLADGDGEALPVNEAATRALADHPVLGPAFRNAYRDAYGIQALDAEKNGSGRSLNGGGKAAPATVTDAKAAHATIPDGPPGAVETAPAS